MPWPNPVSAGVSRVLASQYDDLLSAVKVWGGGVSAGGYALADLGGGSYRTANAGWQEWQFVASAGVNVASDVLALQVNTRAAAGDADSWSDVFRVSRDGAIAFAGSVTGLPTAANWTEDSYANAYALLFRTANVSWPEFSLATNRGVTPAYDRFVLQYNTRSSGGGTDFWAAALTVAAQSGNVAVNSLLTLNGQLVLNAGMNINGQTITGDAHFLNTVFAASLNLAGGQETAVSGNPRFGGAAKFDGAVTFYNTVVSAGGLSVDNGLTLSSGVNCNGQTFSGAANFAGALQFYASVSFSNAAGISIGTNWTAWSPGISTGASYSGYSVIDASYYRLGKVVHFKLAFDLTFTAGSTNYVAVSLPFASPYAAQVVASMIGPGGSNYTPGVCYLQGSGSSQIICYLPGWAAYALSGYSFYLSGTYQVA